MVSEKTFFSCISNYKPMADNDDPEAWPVWIAGPQLPGFIKRSTTYRYTQNMKALDLEVSETISMTHDLDLKVSEVGCDGTS